MEIGERILQIMQEKHLSYRILENKTGISRSTINRYVQGKPIPMDKLEKIAHALGEKPEVLMGWIEPTPLDLLKEKIGRLSASDVERLTAIVDAWLGE